ncbi:MAG TPA: FAD-dependent oxidoreductase [Acidimicrobiales bacterium]|nr:FAD-dependent oxidoreductase [Acidimicrobiales bacterium]
MSREPDVVVDPPSERPLLGAAELATLARYGTEVAVERGDVLFAAGDPSYDLFVVLEGCLELLEHRGSPKEKLIVSYGPREFSGEISLLTGQRAVLTCVVAEPGRVLRVRAEQARTIIAQERVLSEILLGAFLTRHARLTAMGTGLVLLGSRHDSDTRRLLEVLARNRVAVKWLDPEVDAKAEAMLRRLEVPLDDLPIVVGPGSEVQRNPSGPALLAALGLATPLAERTGVCDLLVVGGGPAGLSAAVYGATEGMSTTLAESTALGGQAGTSSRIENYLGFPAGLSGEELAERGVLQAEKFGVRIMLGATAERLDSDGDAHHVRFAGGEVVSARSVIVATGARYNRLPLGRLEEFEGYGVYYAATQMEAKLCGGGPVVVVGGGNSAGQAALFLARKGSEVRVVIRRDSLESTMSRYLVDEIAKQDLISVVPCTEVVGLEGDGKLSGVQLRDSATRTVSLHPACGLFVFIGASPCTDWIGGQLAEDGHGFLLTGADIPAASLEHGDHLPLLLETSRPGIFCVGDARSRSVKRVATAIGEGSMAVRLVFDRLEATGLAVADAPRVEAGAEAATRPGGLLAGEPAPVGA